MGIYAACYKKHRYLRLTAKDIMSANPKTIDFDAMAVDALDVLEENKISQLLAVKDGKYYGVVHLHNLIREGII